MPSEGGELPPALQEALLGLQQRLLPPRLLLLAPLLLLLLEHGLAPDKLVELDRPGLVGVERDEGGGDVGG